MLYPAGDTGKDGESAGDEYRGAVSGAPESVRIRRRGGREGLYRFCGHDDAKHGKAGGSGMPGL